MSFLFYEIAYEYIKKDDMKHYLSSLLIFSVLSLGSSSFAMPVDVAFKWSSALFVLANAAKGKALELVGPDAECQVFIDKVNKSCEKKIVECQKESESYQQQLFSLGNELAQYDNDLTLCRNDFTQCNGKLIQCDLEKEDKQKNLAQCQNDLESKNEQIRILNKNYNYFKDAFDTCSLDLSDLQDQLGKCESDRNLFYAELIQCDGESDMCKSELERCEFKQSVFCPFDKTKFSLKKASADRLVLNSLDSGKRLVIRVKEDNGAVLKIDRTKAPVNMSLLKSCQQYWSQQ